MEGKVFFYSTNLKSPPLAFDQALLKGQAPDMGLYMPDEIPKISNDEIEQMCSMKYHEIANVVIGKFLKDVIPENILADLIEDAYDYDVPLEHVYDRKYIMRLDQGPTASFKDFAGRMMGRLMNYYTSRSGRKLLILTATSGDTGSAIANAFYGLDNINVVVLFPVDEVTPRQRKQMTTLGGNVRILGLDAKFDDCQALVKQAFADEGIAYLNLSSANSINIGRLVPQIVYYFYAYARLSKAGQNENIIFSVPSGNFGDMMGGILAKKMALPIEKFVIATNENDEFPEFVKTGKYQKIIPSKNCISSAMNVGHPSNLVRLFALYGGVMNEKGEILKKPDLDKLRNDIFSVSITDDETKATIKSAWEKYKLLLEPHGSVGWKGLEVFLNQHSELEHINQLCVSLETVHPAKFPEQIREILNLDPELPPSLEGIEDLEEQFDKIESDYAVFKDYLKTNY